jgi:hypothetical protein
MGLTNNDLKGNDVILANLKDDKNLNKKIILEKNKSRHSTIRIK